MTIRQRGRLCPFVLSVLIAGGCDATDDGSPAADGPAREDVTLSPAIVQGSGDAGSLAGRSVAVAGVVSGDFQSHDADSSNDLGGFYILGKPDGDTGTSDGLFVFDDRMPAHLDVEVGDAVVVMGEVSEYFGETQLVAANIETLGRSDVQPVRIVLPAAASRANSDGEPIADLEHLEGMLIRISGPLTVTANRNVDRFGELLLSSGGRLRQFTEDHEPGVEGYRAHREEAARRSLFLDDGRRIEDARPVRYLASSRAGTVLEDLTGVLRYSRGSGGRGAEGWRLMPTTAPRFVAANPREAAPANAGNLRVASLNVNNWFSTVDDGRPLCGIDGNESCRGADSREELHRQLQKIVTTLREMEADIVGLIELENNESRSLGTLVDALNEGLETATWDYVATGTIGGDAIKTGFVYRADRVEAVGPHALLDRSLDPRFDDKRNRPALAQSFSMRSTGATFTVVLNHLKSKGSDCDDDGDPNTGDGQGNCNGIRTLAAEALGEWVRNDPTGSGDPDVLVLGDLNAYSHEDPLVVLARSGLENLLAADASTRYSYVFDGQFGSLDHALGTASLAAQVERAMEWHINADEPDVLDYNLDNGRDPAIFDASIPYRTSDHDPLIVDLNLVD